MASDGATAPPRSSPLKTSKIAFKNIAVFLPSSTMTVAHPYAPKI